MPNYKHFTYQELIQRICESQDEIGIDELKYQDRKVLEEMLSGLEN